MQLGSSELERLESMYMTHIGAHILPEPSDYRCLQTKMPEAIPINRGPISSLSIILYYSLYENSVWYEEPLS